MDGKQTLADGSFGGFSTSNKLLERIGVAHVVIDKEEIQEWLIAHNTDPRSNMQLPSKYLIPNTDFKNDRQTFFFAKQKYSNSTKHTCNKLKSELKQ